MPKITTTRMSYLICSEMYHSQEKYKKPTIIPLWEQQGSVLKSDCGQVCHCRAKGTTN